MLAILLLSACGPREDVALADPALVGRICTQSSTLTAIGTQQACICAMNALVEHFGVVKFRAAILGELPAGMTREEATALAQSVAKVVPEINARCGTHIPVTAS